MTVLEQLAHFTFDRLLVSGVLFTSLLSLVIGFFYITYRPKLSSKTPPGTARDWPIFGDIRFFTQRQDFFDDAVAHSTTGNFSFHVGKYHVVGLTGPRSRQTFFESRQLNFAEGYAILFGQAPFPDRVPDADGNMVDTFTAHFTKRLLSMLKRDTLASSLDKIIADSRALLERLAASSTNRTDPYDSIYKLVYQLTMRTVGIEDIANDPALLAKTLELYETFESSSTTVTVIFPWLPTPAKFKRTVAMARLYMILKSIVDKRKAGERKDDPLQLQVDQGDSMKDIIMFIIGALFAGLLNTGINAAAILCYVAKNPILKAAVLAELTTVAAKHAVDKSASLVDQLSSLPIDVWEKDFPLLDACLKESIRLQMPGSAFRRNTSGKDVMIGEERIPNLAFATYPVWDIHRDPSIYPSPKTYDPARFLPERAEDKKQPYTYMGWGMGRHPCLGMKFAKLESNVIVALFLAKFDLLEVEDKQGKPVEAPEPDRNAWAAGKPKVPVYLNFTSREE